MKIISIALATAVAGLAPLLLPELQQREGSRTGTLVPPANRPASAAREYPPAARPEFPANAAVAAGEAQNNSAGYAARQMNPRLFSLLPDGAGTRNKDTVEGEGEKIKEISAQGSRQVVLTPMTRAEIPADHSPETPLVLAVDIPKVGMVELGADDLARLGISVGDEGIFAAWQEEGKPKPFFIGFTPGGVLTPSSGESEIIPDFMPVAVTDDIGGYRALMYQETEEEKSLLEELRNGGSADGDRIGQELESLQERHESQVQHAVQIGRLVPVLVRTGRAFGAGDSLAGRFRPDCIFWYEPGSKFLDRLPAGVRERVEREMNLAGRLRDAERVADGNAPELRSAIASDVMATVGESPYLDVLRGASGAIMETGIEPNPARERATVTYRLSAPRIVTLSLHDISGRRLRELVPAGPADAGMQRHGVELGGLARGIYLVVLSTDRGERAVQRMIVE